MSSAGVLLAVAAEILWTLLVNFFSSSCYKSVAETGRKAISETYRRVYEKIPEADAVRDTGYFSMRSTDGGKSWGELVRMKGSANHGGIQLQDGRVLVVHLRCHGGDRRTVQCESHDGGRTWGPVHETGILGYPSHLLRLKNGLLLATYASRDAGRYGEYACVSFDDGKNWDVKNEICLTRHFNADLGYPSTAELTNGTLVSVYYQARQPDEKPCLMATKWNLSLMKKE